jgi:hypothetical protein
MSYFIEDKHRAPKPLYDIHLNNKKIKFSGETTI